MLPSAGPKPTSKVKPPLQKCSDRLIFSHTDRFAPIEDGDNGAFILKEQDGSARLVYSGLTAFR